MGRNKNERIGRMDRRITVQGYTETKNDFGEKITDFTDLATVWAAIDYENKGTTEAYEATRETATTTVTFTIRYNKDYRNKKNRILYDEQLYDIISVKEDGRKRFLLLECELKE